MYLILSLFIWALISYKFKFKYFIYFLFILLFLIYINQNLYLIFGDTRIFKILNNINTNDLIKIILNDNELLFSIENTVKQERNVNINSGIGLDNIKKRLNLIYPEAHQLDIQTKDDWFVVRLSISNINPQ
mgnify:CR=1 FL=1